MDDSPGRVSSARRIRFSSVQCRPRSRSLHPWRGDIPHGEPTSFSELFAPALTTCGHTRLVSSGQGRQSEPTHIWSSRFLAFCTLRQDLTLTSIVSLGNCPRGQLRFGGQLPAECMDGVLVAMHPTHRAVHSWNIGAGNSYPTDCQCHLGCNSREIACYDRKRSRIIGNLKICMDD